APRGFEAQIYNGGVPTQPTTGSLFLGLHTPPVARAAVPVVPAGEGFTLDVIARGDHIIVHGNGTTTANHVGRVRGDRRGHIALQSWDRPTVVESRRVEIQEFPPGTDPPAAEEGFAALFNGKDLTGWTVDGGNVSQWAVSGDGSLVGRAAAVHQPEAW